MKYDFKKIEKRWQEYWFKNKTYEPNLAKAKKPFYNLMMFPYPSAEGLHIGNMYAFVGSDIYGRFKRMQGNDVFEPIGLDGFGIHSENYALKVGKHPAKLAKITGKRFYKQLHEIGNGYAWREKLETYDPNYYQWTQWIFIQLFKKGLAYRKKAPVNWCPKCLTVLADEQVISDRCERCESVVVKKELEQWFFKITNYADRLLKNLEVIDWPERVKIAQRNWIGKSEGLIFTAPVKNSSLKIQTFSAHFEAFRADTFVVIAPDHPLLEQLLKNAPNKEKIFSFCKKLVERRRKIEHDDKELLGIFTGLYIVDPVGNGDLPIWVANYAVKEYGTGIVKCSAHDERDFAFAKKYGIRLKPVLFPKDPEHRRLVENLEVCYTDMVNGFLREPREFTGKRAGDVREEIVKYVVRKGLAKPTIQYKLRDWLISRQRYWGPPIPMIFCPACAKASAGKENAGWIPVEEKDLPVKLPYVKDFRPRGRGESPLSSIPEFYKTKCPKCGGEARRETDVSDTFLDSAWYYLRYPSVGMQNSKIKMQNDSSKSRILEIPWNQQITKKWLPVNMYIGGAEHAVLHLLYSRFLAMVFKDLGLVNFEEPFAKFRAHGLLIREGAKMSKSKGNVVNPDFYIKEFGADTLRIYLMFLGPFEQGGDFQDRGIIGISRFLNRVWKLTRSVTLSANEGSLKLQQDSSAMPQNDIRRPLHQTIKKVTKDIETLRFNTAISSLMIFLNELEKSEHYNIKTLEQFLLLLAPFAPHLAEELWHKLREGSDKRREKRGFNSIHKELWPKFDPKLIQDKTFELIIQVNGKLRDKVTVPRAVTQDEAEKLILERPKIKSLLKEAKPKKIVFIAGKLINLVI